VGDAHRGGILSHPATKLTYALGRLAMRTERGPLRPAWRLGYATALRGMARLLRASAGDAVYLRGSVAEDDHVFGLSDLDLYAVVTDRPRIEARLRRFERVAPTLAKFAHASVYDDVELRDSASSTLLTSPGAIFDDPRHHYGLRSRPGAGEPLARWRRIAGPERRPRLPARDRDAQLVAAWLELQCWWRHAVWACHSDDPTLGTSVCLKAVAEPIRTWLWLFDGDVPASRTAALERAADVLPDDAEMAQFALDLRARLAHESRAPFDVVLPWLVGFTARLARRIAAEAGTATEVRLVGDPRSLVDWRALALGRFERLELCDGDPGSAADLRRCAALERPGVVPALRSDDVLVEPSPDMDSRPFPRGTLRSVQCALTDPVTFALLDGRDTATFSTVRGWRAEDWARRARDEARARARKPASREERLAAARAELFAESLEKGLPTLLLDADAVEAATTRTRGAAG
jgi:hypothetical protein